MTSARQNIKRVLALSTGAVLSASAITMIASAPANAAVSDINSLVSSGPARNGGTPGAVVVLKVVPGQVTGTLKTTSSALGAAGSQNTATQTVGNPSIEATIANGATGDSNPTDGLDELVLRVPVTTTVDGATANYAIFEDEVTGGANTDTVQATEPRVQVSTTTAGAPTNVTITPATQTAPRTVPSGNYTVTVRDAGNRITQLDGAETILLTDNSTTTTVTDGTATPTTITAAETPNGTATFTATGTATGLTTISAAGNGGVGGAATNTATATLDVVGAASISAAELNVVTGADSYSDFGDTDNPISVRVDQTSIRLDFRSTDPADANGIVQLTLTGGGGVRFNGQATTTVTTTLNAQGIGSITITPDAGTITDAGTIGISGSGITNSIKFERARFGTIVADSSTVVSKFGGTVDVTVSVRDQFGLPFTSGQLDAQRDGGVNDDGTTFGQRKNIGADGKVTFTFTDTKATAASNASDTIDVRYFPDAFAAAPTQTRNDVATIVYTADGLGADFTVTADGANTAGSAYNPATVFTNPLADAVADTTAERIDLVIGGGTSGSPVTVTVDGGALVINRTAGDADLADAAASKTGAQSDQFSIIGTRTGTVNVTVTQAGRSKTFAVTVQAPVGPARNIAVSGPAEATAGQIAEFVLTVTDAFGNPIPNFAVGGVNVQVSGPGALQDTSGVSNAAGQIKLNVRIDDGASSPVTVNVTGIPGGGNEFGAGANDVVAGADLNLNPGLTASVNTASATIADVVDIDALKKAVQEAQVALTAAEGRLAAAQSTLNSRNAAVRAERADVRQVQKRINTLKKQIRVAKANGNQKRVRTLNAQLKKAQANIKVQRNQVKRAVTAANQARAGVANAQTAVNQARAALAEAQAELDEAQN